MEEKISLDYQLNVLKNILQNFKWFGISPCHLFIYISIFKYSMFLKGINK